MHTFATGGCTTKPTLIAAVEWAYPPWLAAIEWAYPPWLAAIEWAQQTHHTKISI